MRKPTVAVLGASGLIGSAIAADLRHRGWPAIAVARRFAPGQAHAVGEAIELAVVGLDEAALARFFEHYRIEVVVNCIGVLQDGPAGRTSEVHQAFVHRLLAAIDRLATPPLLIHLSVPGNAADDSTSFSRTKRHAERLIAASRSASAILRPGFVIAPAAYGGSALLRSLAVMPVALPPDDAQRPFAVVTVEDVCRTVRFLVERWAGGDHAFKVTWDLMHPEAQTVGSVVDAFRRSLGDGLPRRVRLPSALLALGAAAGDLAGRLGWQPPIRTTALRELRRGVEGDPRPWMAATGIVPRSLSEILQRSPSTVQDRWFARLYLLKPLILLSLIVFWIVSGLIALTVAFDAAAAILIGHGFSPPLAGAVTILSSLADILVGLAIAWRRTSRRGLAAGIGLSLFYMLSAAVITPALWLEPLGALVKTGPAIILMLVALAIHGDR